MKQRDHDFRGFGGMWRRLAVVMMATCTLTAVGQGYQQPTVVKTGSWPLYVGTADLNQDGHADLMYIDGLTASGRSTYHSMLGNGHGGFTDGGPAAWYGSSVVLGDFMGFGVNQIATAYNSTLVGNSSPQCTSAEIAFVLAPLDANGNPTGAYGNGFCLTAAKQPQIGNTTSAVLRAGKSPSLIFTDAANALLYIVDLAGAPGQVPNFSVNALPLPDGAGPVFAADINGDGFTDLIVNGQTGLSAQIFLGGANGIAAGVSPSSRFRGQTGNDDIRSMLLQPYHSTLPALLSEMANGHLGLYFADGKGSFQGGYENLTGTLNGFTGNGGHLVGMTQRKLDGELTMFTATAIGISTLLDSGNAFLTLNGIYNAGPGRSSYALADFNGDGNPDIAVDSPEGIAILYGNPDGSFQTSLGFAAGQPALSVATGVFTSSGNVDAVVSTAATQAQLLEGTPNGIHELFTAVNANGVPTPTTTQTGIAGLWSTVQVGDFNGDGKLDLLVTADGANSQLPASGSATSGVSLQLGTGYGTFGPPSNLSFNSPHCQNSPASLYGRSFVADLNSDGMSDLLTRDTDSAQAFRGQPAAPYLVQYASEIDTSCPNLHAHDLIAAGKVDADGYPKVVEQTDGHIYVYAQTGDLPGDLSVDGSLTTPGQLVAPALSSTFGGVSPTLGFAAFIGSMTIADLDGDGLADLLVAYHNMASTPSTPTVANPNYLYIWYSSGGGKFLTSTKHPVNPVRLTLSRNYYQVAVADVNGDGVPDLLLSDGYLLSVQLGVGDGTFGAETHYLAGQGINGIAAASLRTNTLTDLVIANGGTVFSNPVVNGEVLGTNPDVNTGGITVLLGTTPLQVNPVVTGTVAASPEPSIYAQPFTLTATLVQAVGQVAPTGMVTFSIDGTVVGSGAVVNGSASFPVTTVTIIATYTNPIYLAGAHVLTAAYSGDGIYSAATLTGSHTVVGQPTLSTLTNLDQTIYYGQEIGYDYGVDALLGAQAADPTEAFAPAGLDGGLLNAYIDTKLACSTVYGTGGRCPDPPFEGYSVGTYNAYVVYEGNSYFAPSTSTVYPVTVIPDYTGTVVTSSASPSITLQPVFFTASVTAYYQPVDPTTTTPTVVGMVQFFDGTVPIGTATVNAQGTATIGDAALLVGTHSITACYVVSLNFRASCSAPIVQVVTLASQLEATVTLLTSTPNPSLVGQTVTFAVSVETTGAIIQTPQGTVNLYDGGTLLVPMSLPLSHGQRVYEISTLTAGVHAITAVYGGSGLTAASTSAALQQVVLVSLPPENGFVLTVTPATVSVGVGDSVVMSVAVVGVNPSGQPFTLGCGQLPPETTCVFGQPTLLANGGATTLTIKTTAPHACGASTPYFVASGRVRGLPWLALAGVGLLVVRRRRLRGLVVGAVLVVGLGVGLSPVAGCGGCTDFGTQPNDYGMLVTAAEQGAAAGAAYASQAVAVKVHVHL